MLEHLERSMTRFHDHQTETLSVHERHLKNQAGFSETSIQLLQQQYALLTNSHVSASERGAVPGCTRRRQRFVPCCTSCQAAGWYSDPVLHPGCTGCRTKPLTHESSWHVFRHRFSEMFVQGADRGSQRKDGLSGRDARTGHGHGGRSWG